MLVPSTLMAITKALSSLDQILYRRNNLNTLIFVIIRQCVEEKKIFLFYVKGAENPADMFTKNLGRVKFLKFRSQLGLKFNVAHP